MHESIPGMASDGHIAPHHGLQVSVSRRGAGHSRTVTSLKKSNASAARFGWILGCLWGGSLTLLAGTFQYQSEGDLLVGFRHPESSFEFLVNAGPVLNLTDLTPGASLTVEGLTPERLSTAFASLDGVRWSAFGARLTSALPPVRSTLWLTRSREENQDQPTPPWLQSSPVANNVVRTSLQSVGNTCRTWAAGGSAPPANSLRNNNNALIYPSRQSPGIGYALYVGSRGNWDDKFWGVVEDVIPADFSGSATRHLDLFTLRATGQGVPEGSLGEWLGTFELSGAGVLRFVRAGGAAPIPAPMIVSVVPLERGIRISFTTTADAAVQYGLRFTNLLNLSTAPATWAQGSQRVVGDGNIHSFEDLQGEPDRAYLIEATR